MIESQRIFTGEGKAPRVVAVLGLCPDLDFAALERVVEGLETAAGVTGDHRDGKDGEGDEKMEGSSERPYGLKTVQLPANRFKSSTIQFLLLPHQTPLPNVLSSLTGSDFLLTVLSPEEECSAWGETALRSLQAAGTATGVIGLVSTLEPVLPKEQSKTRTSLLSFLHYFFPPASSTGHGLLLDKVIAADQPGEAANVVRSLTEKAPREVKWREGRGRIVAEELSWSASTSDDELGTLAATGVVRGGPLSANRLIHVPLVGDFRISKITAAPLEGPRSLAKVSAMQTTDKEPGALLSERNDEDADDLVSTNVPSEGDALLGEQTWPTEEEMASAPANGVNGSGDMPPPAAPGTTPKAVRRLPKGTSAYQAAWILDDDEGDYSSDDSEGDEDAKMGDAGDAASVGSVGAASDEVEYEDIDVSSNADGPSSRGGVHFQDLPEDVEASQLADYRARERAERDDAEFPDEIDTPMDIPARQRFARYRGLRSFRTSEWDPFENLPEAYGRLFGFEDWKGMGRRLLRRAAEEASAPQPGTRVTIYIEGVSRDAHAAIDSTLPLVLVGLLRHEHKYSVMNFTAQRNTEHSSTIRSKDDLILSVGPRFFSARPLWSQHTQRSNGRGINNVHKFERFLRPGTAVSVGTVALPVTFGSVVPVLVLKPESEGMELVGSGTLLGSDTTRIVAKRIVLTGHPYKVHKKTATIRYLVCLFHHHHPLTL